MSYPFGIHADISNEDYHALKEIEGLPAVSSSFVKAWYKTTPYHATADLPEKQSTAFDIGTAVHGWALEGVVPIKGTERRAGKAWQDAVAEAKLLDTVALNHADFEKVEQCVEALYNNPHIKLLLEHKKRVCEASVFVKHEGLCLKARPDLYIQSQGIIADIKTTQSANPYEFEQRTMDKFGYTIQAAFYWKVMQLAQLPMKRFLFINVEKEPPFATSIVEVGEKLIEYGTTVVNNVLAEIQVAEKQQDYSTGWPPVHVANDLPGWIT